MRLTAPLTRTMLASAGIAAFAAAGIMAGVGAGPAFAAGDGTPTTKECVERDSNGNCTKWKGANAGRSTQWARAGDGTEPAGLVEAVWLADQGKYAAAIAKLEALHMPDHPDVLNYLGYANRKLGNVDLGISYYKQALAIDPRHVGVHEYMGEAYLQKGDVATAKKLLDRIEGLCGGRTCDQYQALAEEIRLFETENRG